ncbi:MAG: DUF805 domain-containing protein [Proteobacteria bacterium]|nr:DUF805 domain-containing protein [Pseudomonadota bacterium]NDD04415.1 DUF805 domain-containing protein [Pseudomonadota bacterium]
MLVFSPFCIKEDFLHSKKPKIKLQLEDSKMNSYLRSWEKAFDFKGRSNRQEFLVFTLVNLGIYSLLYGLFLFFQGPSVGIQAFSLGALVPTLALGARRLHDINKSGWWQALGIIPIFGPLFLLFLMLKEGTPGTNDYGPQP